MHLQRRLSLPALLAALLLICASITASPTTLPESSETSNFGCPLDCTCNLARHTHTPLLHAKCNGIRGLKAADEPLNTTAPIHSVDLSYLGLTRAANLLDRLADVTSVDLSHNELHELGHLSKRIKKLNLKHNRLTSAKLAKLPQHLQWLNLQHNDITTLPLELTHLQHLQQLELSHNSINCSCETLEVRNWLQERHVYMEQAVVCSYPKEASGKSWLQLKQSDVCEKEERGWNDMSLDDNELMMGDQPAAGSGEDDNEEEELGKDYLPIAEKEAHKAKVDTNDVEGSGDMSNMNMPINLPIQASEPSTEPSPIELDPLQEEDDDEGSGSGGGLLIIKSDPHISEDFDASDPDPEESNETDKDNDLDNQPVEEPKPTDLFTKIGIFNSDPHESQPVSEESIVPVVQKEVETSADAITDAPLDAQGSESEDILSANMNKKDDTNATYYLLGVIALIIVGLILFVAIKRCKYNSSTAARDAEAQRQTELLDMDKKNLGKPLARNGGEHSPLIAEKSKLDQAQPINGAGKKPYDNKDIKDGVGQQPLLNGNGTSNGAPKDMPTINEPANEAAPHEYYPITPRYPTPQSPRASKYAQHPQAGGEQNNNEPDNSYLPSSPKSGRYSPVYSPETGRVKIKLTETPKPKTPMLVTRSKSGAGDIITTPVQPAVHQQQQQQQQLVGGGANGHANY